jgi:hypothetical protein
MNSSEKFLFICGGLEPGKDGIGDYVRRIASYLAKLGHRTLIISFGDKFVKEHFEKTTIGFNCNVTIYRFRDSLVEGAVFRVANSVLKEFSPSLISIQYNPFSFNSKGLPFRFLFFLKRLLGPLPVHVVFHELWNSIAFPISLRSKLYSPFQKLAVAFLIREFNVVASYTTNECYQNMLFCLGIASALIPVFSNIPIAGAIDTLKYNQFVFIDEINARPMPILAIFGNQIGALSDQKINQMLHDVGLCCDPALLLVIGNQTSRSQGIVKQIASCLPSNSRLCYSKFLEEKSISELLCKIDCALTSYPYELAGKSGAIAAVLEHGKPVFFVGVDIDKCKDLRHLDGSQHTVSLRLDQALRHIESAALKSVKP